MDSTQFLQIDVENGAAMAHATTRAFADERRAAIMEMLEHNASVQVAEIAQTFGVSSVTARADLDLSLIHI